MTSNPEPNHSPKTYDHHEAVCYASAWTGLDSSLVDQVLSAKFRYLELAGIALSEVDGTLLKEREAYRHLLPETPDFIDERINRYMVQVTGLDEATVLRIDQGEMAYKDSLDMIAWVSNEERDATLGSPELPEEETPGDFDLDEEDRPMLEGHGDHWGSVVSDLGSFIYSHLTELPGIEHLRFHVPSPYSRWEGVTARAIPQTDQLETIRLDGDSDGESELITAFPVARDGAVWPLTLQRARPWKAGCEAIVLASTAFGASIAYFDTEFLHPRNQWAPDEEQNIALAAFAYSLEPAPAQVIPISQEDKVRAIRAIELGISPEEVTDLSPIEIRTEGLACLLPHRNGNPDEFNFQGPVVGVDLVHAWGQTLFRLDVTVMRDTESKETVPFTLPVYVGQHNLPEGYRPRVGEDVRGLLWMQGYPAGSR